MSTSSSETIEMDDAGPLGLNDLDEGPLNEAIALAQVKVGEETSRQVDGRYFTRLDGFIGWERTTTGVRVEVGDSIVEIDFVENDFFRLQIERKDGPGSGPTFAVTRPRSTWGASFEVEETADAILLVSEAVEIVLGKSPFRISAYRADGSVVLAVDCEELGSFATLNDEFIVTRNRSSSFRILGLGQKTGANDRSGRSLILWNTDVLNPRSVKEFTTGLRVGDPKGDPRSQEFDPYYISIPFYQELDEDGRAAGFFLDNHHRADYDFSQEGKAVIRVAGGVYVEYVFAGPDLRRIIEGYTSVTGRISPPPIWALGYHHCRWHPYSAQDVISHAKAYRTRGIPCDSMWLDIEHMQGYRVFTWNQKLFPSPAETLGELAKLKFRAVTIVDPGVKVEPGYPVYDSGLEKGAFCLTEGGAIYRGQVWPGKTAFPDFASETAREWWGELNAKHLQLGLSGIWNDMNEPATGDIPDQAMRFDGGKYPHGAYHNAYALLMAMSTSEGLRRAAPDRRPFILSRAGSAGIQRYAANWLGDNMSRWEHLEMSIPMSLGLGLSGQPFVGADIGGFGENCEPELQVRWFQAACLSPFCRNHNDAGGVDQYPWSFGPEAEKLCKDALELRYRLMPYLYEAFIEASETGAPIMAPLILEDQAEGRFADVSDEYLLGRSLLVAPVVTKGQVERSVAFPKGDWFDWWTGDAVGAGELIVKTPLSKVPLFARGGSVIPMWPEAPGSTMGYQPETVELHVFVPSEDGVWRSRLVEDDGETNQYESGERLVTTFTLTRTGGSLKLEATTAGSAFEGFDRSQFCVVFRGDCSLESETVRASTDGFRLEWAL